MSLRCISLFMVFVFYSIGAYAAPKVEFLSSRQMVSEQQGDVEVFIRLSRATDNTVTVPFVVDGRARYGDDHNLQDGKAVIEPGDKEAVISFNVFQDDVLEGSEDVSLQLLAPNNARLGDNTSYTVSIVDHSLSLPEVSFTKAESEVSEGDSINVTARLKATSNHTVIVPFSISGSTDSDDHNLRESAFVFAPGERRANVRISFFTDENNEDEENLVLSLTGPAVNASIGHTSVHTISLQDTTPDPEYFFITRWKTDNPGSSDDNQISFRIRPGGDYDFVVDWGDNTTERITGYDNLEIMHTYEEPGTYTVKITGKMDTFYLGYNHDAKKILEVSQWGTIKWGRMIETFMACSNLIVTASDSPDLSQVTDMRAMFKDATSFNGEIGHWDTSNVQNMKELFAGAENFNQDIGNWDTSKVTNMGGMFFDTTFNKDISKWDTANVENMRTMFRWTSNFNQDISSWDTSKVSNMASMFARARQFNQDLSGWDVSNVSVHFDFDKHANSDWSDEDKPVFPESFNHRRVY